MSQGLTREAARFAAGVGRTDFGGGVPGEGVVPGLGVGPGAAPFPPVGVVELPPDPVVPVVPDVPLPPEDEEEPVLWDPGTAGGPVTVGAWAVDGAIGEPAARICPCATWVGSGAELIPSLEETAEFVATGNPLPATIASVVGTVVLVSGVERARAGGAAGARAAGASEDGTMASPSQTT